MAEAKVILTNTYKAQLTHCEDFIFTSSKSVDAVKSFILEHDKAIEFIKQNYKTPAPHPQTGDQSWPFFNGRYRLFFNTKEEKNNKVTIYLIDLIDNRMFNKKVYPNNSLPSYYED